MKPYWQKIFLLLKGYLRGSLRYKKLILPREKYPVQDAQFAKK